MRQVVVRRSRELFDKDKEKKWLLLRLKIYQCNIQTCSCFPICFHQNPREIWVSRVLTLLSWLFAVWHSRSRSHYILGSWVSPCICRMSQGYLAANSSVTMTDQDLHCSEDRAPWPPHPAEAAVRSCSWYLRSGCRGCQWQPDHPREPQPRQYHHTLSCNEPDVVPMDRRHH